MTTTAPVTVKPIIAAVREGHYAIGTQLVSGLRYLLCVCGFSSRVDDVRVFAGHMVDQLGHRVQSVAFNPEDGAVTLVCTCLHETTPTTDGTAWPLFKAHQDAPDAGPLVPAQGDAPVIEQDDDDTFDWPFEAMIVRGTVRARLYRTLAASGYASGVDRPLTDCCTVRFRRDLIDAVRAGEVPGLQLAELPAGTVLQLTHGGIEIPLTYRIR